MGVHVYLLFLLPPADLQEEGGGGETSGFRGVFRDPETGVLPGGVFLELIKLPVCVYFVGPSLGGMGGPHGGEAGEVFPWGSAYECGRANLWADCSGCEDGYDGPAPVSAFPAGASWCGALDMAGNVWEWVADRFTEYPGASDDSPAESDGTRVLRGGSWGYCPAFARAAYRYPVPAGADYLAVGFRCAISAGEAGPAR